MEKDEELKTLPEDVIQDSFCFDGKEYVILNNKLSSKAKGLLMIGMVDDDGILHSLAEEEYEKVVKVYRELQKAFKDCEEE